MHFERRYRTEKQNVSPQDKTKLTNKKKGKKDGRYKHRLPTIVFVRTTYLICSSRDYMRV